ncbi:MAG: PqqD family protein [Luteimonas sp.]
MTATPTSVTLADHVRLTDDVLVQEVGGEAVLLDLDSERYFSLDPVGTRIWALIGEQNSLQSIADTLCEEYEAEPERIRSDLLTLVGQLAKAGLVKVD